MEGYSGLSEKGASGNLCMGAGPPAMGADAVAVAVSAVRFYSLRHCLWDRSLFIMEVVLVSFLYRSSMSQLCTYC